ncbi:hypothetical protein [Glutamicibacter arilaitensis]|uniref:hypothetical protein n=1 Tax=Glutamicibacter arilaitensis TaxID=256701 RepID=UPI003F9370BF
MGSINNLIVRAEKVGRYAADLAHDGSQAFPPTDKAHHPGDDTGRLVLEAFRNYGIEEMNSVIVGYQRGYNARAQELGDSAVRWVQIRNGIGWALPGATEAEEEAIKAGMDL